MTKSFRTFSSALALAVAVISASSAQAATYIGNRTIGTGSVNLSITTDGTLGVINSANIVDYSIDLLNLDSSFSLNQANSDVFINGTAFTATTTDLLFNFGSNGFALFQAPGIGSGETFYCLQGGSTGCFDFAGPGEGVEANGDYVFPRASGSGVQSIATASMGAVPEPTTWILMLLGMAGIGFSMRRKANQTVRVAYA